MPESAYGPPYSGDAMDAAEDACAAAGEGRMGAKVALDAAHDPANGLDMSVCLRDVLTAILRADPAEVASMDRVGGDGMAWYLRREFGVPDAR